MAAQNSSNAARRLPILPSMPKGRGATAWNQCRCGCGGGTQSTFVPGHDARLKGLMIRVIREIMTLEDVEEWGGKPTRRAVETGLKDARLMKRWNLDAEVEAMKQAAAAAAAEAEAEDTDADESESDSDDDADSDDTDGATTNA